MSFVESLDLPVRFFLLFIFLPHCDSPPAPYLLNTDSFLGMCGAEFLTSPIYFTDTASLVAVLQG